MKESMNKAQRIFVFSLINEYVPSIEGEGRKKEASKYQDRSQLALLDESLSCPLKLTKDDGKKGRILSLRNEITCG